eukprot:5544535-Amphidinium_carterae.1
MGCRSEVFRCRVEWFVWPGQCGLDGVAWTVCPCPRVGIFCMVVGMTPGWDPLATVQHGVLELTAVSSH